MTLVVFTARPNLEDNAYSTICDIPLAETRTGTDFNIVTHFNIQSNVLVLLWHYTVYLHYVHFFSQAHIHPTSPRILWSTTPLLVQIIKVTLIISCTLWLALYKYMQVYWKLEDLHPNLMYQIFCNFLLRSVTAVWQQHVFFTAETQNTLKQQRAATAEFGLTSARHAYTIINNI